MELSDLRRDPSYTKYYTFLTRLVITGIIPILALVFFNINIYLVKAVKNGKVKEGREILLKPKYKNIIVKGLRASRRRRSQHMLTPNR